MDDEMRNCIQLIANSIKKQNEAIVELIASVETLNMRFDELEKETRDEFRTANA